MYLDSFLSRGSSVVFQAAAAAEWESARNRLQLATTRNITLRKADLQGRQSLARHCVSEEILIHSIPV